MTLGAGVVVDEFVHPIGVVLRGAVLVDEVGVVLRPVDGTAAAVSAGLVHDGHVLTGVEDFVLTIDLLSAIVAIVGDGAFALFAALGGDKDYAVGSLRTVDGGGGSVFEDVDALDVGGIKGGDVATDTVNKVERLSVADGTQTADVNTHAGSRLTRSGLDVDTRGLTLEGLKGIVCVEFLDVVALNLNGGTSDEFFLLYTVANNDNLVEVGGFLFKNHLYDLTVEDNLLTFKTEEGEEDGRTVVRHQ